MLEQKIDNWTFRFIQLKSDVIKMQDNATNLWSMNLTIAVLSAPDDILPDTLFSIVNNQLMKDGFFQWGIIKGGSPLPVSGIKVIQPHEVEGIPEESILTISLDYRILVSF